MVINSREIAKHLYRLSQLLEAKAAHYLALQVNNQSAIDLQKDSDEIKEMAEFLYDARENLEIPKSSEYGYIFYDVCKQSKPIFISSNPSQWFFKECNESNGVLIDIVNKRRYYGGEWENMDIKK